MLEPYAYAVIYLHKMYWDKMSQKYLLYACIFVIGIMQCNLSVSDDKGYDIKLELYTEHTVYNMEA